MPVVLKILGTTDQESRLRALREASLLSAISHPNIVALFGIYRCDTQIVLILEYCVTDLLDVRRKQGEHSLSYLPVPHSRANSTIQVALVKQKRKDCSDSWHLPSPTATCTVLLIGELAFFFFFFAYLPYFLSTILLSFSFLSIPHFRSLYAVT